MVRGLSLERFTISGNSVSAAVCVFPHNLRVTEDMANSMLALRPTLAEHVCKHHGMGFFGDKLIDTSLPHLVEHLAIDLLVEANRQNTQAEAVAGITTWLDRSKGIMQVRISYTTQSAEETCAAITHAIAMVNRYL